MYSFGHKERRNERENEMQQLTSHQKNLIRAHYGDYDDATWSQIEADLAAGNFEFDFAGIQEEYPEVTA